MPEAMLEAGMPWEKYLALSLEAPHSYTRSITCGSLDPKLGHVLRGDAEEPESIFRCQSEKMTDFSEHPEFCLSRARHDVGG